MILTIERPPLRAIELYPTDRRRGLWQAFYAGDEWTEQFITTIGWRPIVENALRNLDNCCGLPVVIRDGAPAERAA